MFCLQTRRLSNYRPNELHKLKSRSSVCALLLLDSNGFLCVMEFVLLSKDQLTK